MKSCQNCAHFSKWYVRDEPKPTKHKFLWWSWEEEPDEMDVHLYLRSKEYGTCNRMPKAEDKRIFQSCGEFSPKAKETKGEE